MCIADALLIGLLWVALNVGESNYMEQAKNWKKIVALYYVGQGGGGGGTVGQISKSCAMNILMANFLLFSITSD